jgi:hypothetical protein
MIGFAQRTTPERDYKRQAHERGTALLGLAAFTALLKDNEYQNLRRWEHRLSLRWVVRRRSHVSTRHLDGPWHLLATVDSSLLGRTS